MPLPSHSSHFLPSHGFASYGQKMIVPIGNVDVVASFNAPSISSLALCRLSCVETPGLAAGVFVPLIAVSSIASGNASPG